MEAVNNAETLPAVAKLLRDLIPELKGRAIPVTDAEVTKDNVPTLPIAMVAPIVQNFTHNGGFDVTVAEDFMMEFWLPPIKEKNTNGTEAPFWAYYEYNRFRDRLFAHMAGWRSPQNGTVTFISMDVESNQLATILSIRARNTYRVCLDTGETESPATISFNICAPSNDCVPDCEEEKDPCP